MRIILLAAAMAASPAIAQTGDWAGTYAYTETLGRDGAGRGNAIVVEHRLMLGGEDGCRLTAKGYQTDEDIRCTALPDGKGMRIAFQSYADGSLRNRYGVAQYQPGTTLFTLTPNGRGLTTKWGSYVPDEARGPGRYFAKR